MIQCCLFFINIEYNLYYKLTPHKFAIFLLGNEHWLVFSQSGSMPKESLYNRQDLMVKEKNTGIISQLVLK